MAEEKIIPGVATEKESDEVLEKIVREKNRWQKKR